MLRASRLLDLDTLPAWLGGDPESEQYAEQSGAVRLAAALALLRLVRRHDVRMPRGLYCLLALTMQVRVGPSPRRRTGGLRSF